MRQACWSVVRNSRQDLCNLYSFVAEAHSILRNLTFTRSFSNFPSWERGKHGLIPMVYIKGKEVVCFPFEHSLCHLGKRSHLPLWIF